MGLFSRFSRSRSVSVGSAGASPSSNPNNTSGNVNSNGDETFFVLAEDEGQNLLSVEGEGVGDIAERRAEVFQQNLIRCFKYCFESLPCCIVWSNLFCSEDDQENQDGTESENEASCQGHHDSKFLKSEVWPSGFGPGWIVRTFCPMIILAWCLMLHYGVTHAFKLFDHLDGTISAPKNSPSAKAIDAYVEGFKHAAKEDYLTNTMIIIERLDGTSVLTPEIEQFCLTLRSAVSCPDNVFNELHECTNSLDFLRTVYKYEGYYMVDTMEERKAIEPYFVNGNSTVTMVYIKHSINDGLFSSFFDYLDAFLASNGPNPSLYHVTYANEIKLLEIAQDEVVYDFEHADLIGIPFAWFILVWYCGFPAFLVLISLPVSILCSFSLSVDWMPKDLKLPTFAPSIILSMAVALNVDYALFMLVRFSEEAQRGANRNYALDKSMSTAGKTIAVSGVIMLISNGCLYFVHAETVASLGIALALTNMLTIAVNISLLPALLCAFGAVFDRLRVYKCYSISGGAIFVVQILIFPFKWLFDAVFGSGRKRKGVKVVRHHGINAYEAQHEELLIEDDESLATSSLHSPTSMSGASMSDNVLGVSAAAVNTVNGNEALFGPIYEEALLSAPPVATTNEPSSRQEDTTTASTSNEKKADKVLSANSRIWASIAKLCLNYPKAIVLTVVVLCVPVCVQVARFEWTDSQANLLPKRNSFVRDLNNIGKLGFAEGFLADYKAIIASPNDDTAKYPLDREQCFDDDAVFDTLKSYIKDIPPDVGITCSEIVSKLPDRCNFNFHNISNILKDYCPYSCNSCRVELFTSRNFWRHIMTTSDILLQKSMQYSTMDMEAAGGLERAKVPMIESPSFYLGREFTWEKARSLLSHRHREERSEDMIDKLYRERIHNMTSINATEVLYRLHLPFNPFDQLAHPFVNDVRDTMKKSMSMKETSQFRFYCGGAVVQLFDQVDQVFKETPPVMLGAVILTVLGTSVLVFQSFLLGPRLLVTILLTLGLVFGVCVVIFQDMHASPDSAGLYWIVPVLAVPVLVGCTLDYDSFVVARIFELRLAGLDTEAAVFCGLQETGHVITIAGIIMCVAFGSMLFSSIPVIQQIGALLVTCCLLDTFIIRSLLVPSLMLVAVDWNWYPKEMPPVTITMDMLRDAATRAATKRSRRDPKTRSPPDQEEERDGDGNDVETATEIRIDDVDSVSSPSSSLFPLRQQPIVPPRTTSGGSWASLT